MSTIAAYRLHNQQLEQPRFRRPGEIVGWLAAVQAQEYAGAKWALGLRLPGSTEAEIEQAFADGEILRTHLMRPTWHFVTPADIRWMLDLTAPRVHQANAYYYRKFELDDAVFRRSNAALTGALEGNRRLTRTELASVLAQIGIVADGLRLSYLMMHAELDGLICSGPRSGKQFTYALLDERVARAAALSRDEALATLSKRYLLSRGPASAQDFAGWSGLTIADARAGIDMVKSDFVHEEIDGRVYWRSPSDPPPQPPSPTAYLLPPYDEYVMGYQQHHGVLDPAHLAQAKNAVFGGVTLIDGQLVGNWRGTVSRKQVVIDLAPFRPHSEAERQALTAAAQRYQQFLNMPVVFA